MRPDDPALAKAAGDIEALRELTSAALAEMRALIFEVRPDALAEAGLATALTRQAAALTARSGVTVTVTGPGERLPVPVAAEEQAYRVALEALHNAVKHSGARQASVTIANLGDLVEVAVADNEAGFDPTAIGPGHLGLRTMRDVAAQVSAALDLQARPGEGTTVRLRIPAANPTGGAMTCRQSLPGRRPRRSPPRPGVLSRRGRRHRCHRPGRRGPIGAQPARRPGQ